MFMRVNEQFTTEKTNEPYKILHECLLFKFQFKTRFVESYNKKIRPTVNKSSFQSDHGLCIDSEHKLCIML